MSDSIKASSFVISPGTPNKFLSCRINSTKNENELTRSRSQGNIGKSSSKSTHIYDTNSMSQQIISAKLLRLPMQKNEIQNLKGQLEIITSENRTLRTQNFKQERELIQIDNQDLNITKLIEQHEAEIQIFKDQIRKAKTTITHEQSLRKEAENESINLKTALNKSKEIISNKGLIDKAELRRQLDEALENLSYTKNLLQKTQSKLDYLDGNYKVELLNCKKQSKSYLEKCEELESKINFLNVALREKEKLLEIQNIYSNRLNKTKLTRKCENAAPCSNCAIRNKEKNLKSKSRTETKFLSCINKCDNFIKKNECSQQIVFHDKKDPVEFNRYKILEDIRKIISEEIKLGNLTIIYNPVNSSNDQLLIPMIPSTIEKQVDSPFVDEDTGETEKSTIIAIEEPQENVSKTSKDIPRPSSVKQISIKNAIFQLQKEKNDLMRSKPKSKVRPYNPNSSQDKIETNGKVEPKLKYMYPNLDCIVSADDWWDDLETISVLNTVCDVNAKSSKVDNDKERVNCPDLLTHHEKPLQSIHLMYKLPKPIIEDLKNKEILKEKSFSNLISESRLNKVCVGNISHKNVTFQLPLTDFKKNEKFPQCSS